MIYFFIFLLLCLCVAFIGSYRKLGFVGAFLVSFIFSPIVGLIVTLFSKSLSVEKKEEELKRILKEEARLQRELKIEQLKTERKLKKKIKKNKDILSERFYSNLDEEKNVSTTKYNYVDELFRLSNLKGEGIITENEFLLLKEKLINKN